MHICVCVHCQIQNSMNSTRRGRETPVGKDSVDVWGIYFWVWNHTEREENVGTESVDVWGIYMWLWNNTAREEIVGKVSKRGWIGNIFVGV